TTHTYSQMHAHTHTPCSQMHKHLHLQLPKTVQHRHTHRHQQRHTHTHMHTHTHILMGSTLGLGPNKIQTISRECCSGCGGTYFPSSTSPSLAGTGRTQRCLGHTFT